MKWTKLHDERYIVAVASIRAELKRRYLAKLEKAKR